MPPIRNEIQTAAPATAPASPSSAKMPAPIIEPIPSTVAPRRLIVRGRSGASAASTGSVSLTRRTIAHGEAGSTVNGW